jgi:hypothetical protein
MRGVFHATSELDADLSKAWFVGRANTLHIVSGDRYVQAPVSFFVSSVGG